MSSPMLLSHHGTLFYMHRKETYYFSTIVKSYQHASYYFDQHCHQNDILSRWRNTWLAYLMSQMGEAVCNIDAVELSHVCINDTVSFKLKMVEIGEEKELQMVMKAVVVQDGTELCTVGFLGKNIVALEKTRF